MLEIKQLTVRAADKTILDNVSFKAMQGKITAIVGGSGSGKTTIASCVLGLLPVALKITQGQIIFDQENLLGLDNQQMAKIRGKSLAMIFQEPLWAFNPLMTIGQQIDEVLSTHTNLHKQDRRQKILDTLVKVQLSNPTEIYHRYPHQLSGGQRQRALIAQALVANPRLIIADEATSNLDVTVQARIIDLFRKFKAEGLTMLLISHNLGLVSHLADEVVILEEGRVIEAGPVGVILKNPTQKYTKALLEAFA